MVVVPSLALKKAEFKTGMDIPGIGKATVDPDKKIISVSRMLTLNKATLPEHVPVMWSRSSCSHTGPRPLSVPHQTPDNGSTR